MMKREELCIEMTVNGHKGNAEVKWFPEHWDYDQQCTRQGEYKVFISVPFQDSRWESLFVFDENKREVAIEKAYDLSHILLYKVHCNLPVPESHLHH